MKRSLILILTALISGTAVQAQIVSGKEVQARQTFKLNGTPVTGISNDTNRFQRRTTHLVTEWAMKNYADSGKFPFKLGYLLVPMGDTGVAVDSAELAGMLVGGGGTPNLSLVTAQGATTKDSVTLTGYATNKRIVNIAPRGLNGSGEIQVRDTFSSYSFMRPNVIGFIRNGSYQLQLQSMDNHNSILNMPGTGLTPRYIPVSVNGIYADNTGNIPISTGGNQWTGTGVIRNTDSSGSVSVNTALSQAALHVKGGIICDSNRIGNDWFYTKKVTLTPAQIYTLNSSPVEIIPAPGLGKAVDVISCNLMLVYNSAPYTGGPVTFLLKYDTDDYFFFNNVNSEVTETTGAKGDYANQFSDFIENTPVFISSQGDIDDGDSNIYLYIYYRIINI